MFSQIKNMTKIIKQLIQKEIQKNRSFDIYIVDNVYPETFTCDIRNYYKAQQKYVNVKIAGIGLGNFDGIIKMPRIDDMVLVGYLAPNTPIVLANLFTPENGREITADVIPQIKAGETLIVGNRKGSYIFINTEGNVLVKSDNVKLAGNNGNAVARVGDTVSVEVTAGSSAGTYSGTITTGSEKVTSE